MAKLKRPDIFGTLAKRRGTTVAKLEKAWDASKPSCKAWADKDKSRNPWACTMAATLRKVEADKKGKKKDKKSSKESFERTIDALLESIF